MTAKKRKKQQSPFFEGFLVLRPNAQLDEAAGREKDDRLGSAQENAQTLPFDRRVKAADDGNACIHKFLDEIVGLRDYFRRATG